jgi:uncharacterized protein
MSRRPAFVFDVNVIVSALLFPDSSPGRAFLRALDEGVLLISDHSVSEFQEVLDRPKFDRYVLREERMQFLATLVREAELIETTVDVQVCRDPKDNHVLELAVSGGATCIVSGDSGLLVLNPFQGIPILTPAAFLSAPAPWSSNTSAEKLQSLLAVSILRLPTKSL